VIPRIRSPDEKETTVVQKSRCTGCGYYHIGPAPEFCPVCGAPKSSFGPYDGPADLTGSKTFDNLKAAFAGESQANRRYTLWRRIAELEGAPQAALDAFDRAAAEETAHALGHLAYIAGATGTTENLRMAMAGEDDEATDMYPGFAEIADSEGFSDIAYYFRSLGRFEGEHREEYRGALGEME
jgi:rubrerythrin